MSADPLDKASDFNMAGHTRGSGHGAISFPAGNDDFRAARNNCARACRRFNETAEDAPPAVRIKRWLEIVQPGSSRSGTVAAVTGEMTFRDPSLKPQAPFIKPPIYMDYGLRVHVGSTTFINRYCMIMDTPVADVVIGERCSIGPHCSLVSVGHPLGETERNTKRSSSGKEIRIGDGVWIGAGVTIMGGVTIGDGAVIGAGSLVTRDIPARSLAYGVPAKVDRILNDHEVSDIGGSVETLEEALKFGTDHPAVPAIAYGDNELKRSFYEHDTRTSQTRRFRAFRMSRAEILAALALAFSFLTSLLFAMLIVVAKRIVATSVFGSRDL